MCVCVHVRERIACAHVRYCGSGPIVHVYHKLRIKSARTQAYNANA